VKRSSQLWHSRRRLIPLSTTLESVTFEWG